MAPKTPPGQTRGQIFRFVRDRLLQGLPPTVREVQQAFGFRSVQTAREHLETLVDEGKLAKEPGKARGYRLPKNPSEGPFAFVPLLGRVQAGALTTAVEDPEGYVPVQGLATGDGLFALRVRGESMVGAGILPGDLVIVRRQPDADPGDIVVALVEDEATVKRLRLKSGRVELHPENPRFDPIIPDPNDLALLGKVIEIRRYLEKAHA
ncbi:MAG: repressor LexA [bacterium]|nr:repressor LexA [bacterium]